MRIGEIRDDGRARSENFPEEFTSEKANEVLKAIRNENKEPILIGDEEFRLLDGAKGNTEPRVFENQTKGFVVGKSYRSLIIAFYDTREQIIDL